MNYIIVITTCAERAEADRISVALIEARLAACVQAHEVVSTYRWKGTIETAREIRLLIKARSADYPEIEKLICSMHSYENPQIIAVPITAGSSEYLGWIADETLR